MQLCLPATVVSYYQPAGLYMYLHGHYTETVKWSYCVDHYHAGNAWDCVLLEHYLSPSSTEFISKSSELFCRARWLGLVPLSVCYYYMLLVACYIVTVTVVVTVLWDLCPFSGRNSDETGTSASFFCSSSTAHKKFICLRRKCLHFLSGNTTVIHT